MNVIGICENGIQEKSFGELTKCSENLSVPGNEVTTLLPDWSQTEPSNLQQLWAGTSTATSRTMDLFSYFFLMMGLTFVRPTHWSSLNGAYKWRIMISIFNHQKCNLNVTCSHELWHVWYEYFRGKYLCCERSPLRHLGFWHGTPFVHLTHNILNCWLPDLTIMPSSVFEPVLGAGVTRSFVVSGSPWPRLTALGTKGASNSFHFISIFPQPLLMPMGIAIISHSRPSDCLALQGLYILAWNSIRYCIKHDATSWNGHDQLIIVPWNFEIFHDRPDPGPLFTKKTPSYQYRDSHYKPEAVVRPS